MALPLHEARGLFLFSDPHVAATPPGQRLEGYQEQVLDKVRACLERAAELDMVPVILGDLFHWPRENPNGLLVALIELLRPHRPWVLVGNHDKYQARYTPDVSMAVLDAAGAIRLMAESGPQFRLRVSGGGAGGDDAEALVGASPDMTPIPREFALPAECAPDATVLWATHHGIGFPEYEHREKYLRPRDIPGVHWVVNGHLHHPQPMQVRGGTRWVNVGGLVRVQFSRYNVTRRPGAMLWRPGAEELEVWEAPHLPFDQVFPDQEFPPEEEEQESASRFLSGLERLAWRRTREGTGLKQFLEENLADEPESRLIWELYEEVVHGQGR